jgi:hypothetical protein
MMFRVVFWDILPCKMIVDRRFRGTSGFVWIGSRGSSFSILSGYGLGDRIEVRSSAEAKDFSSDFLVQTGSGAHPISCTMVPGVLSLEVKRGRGVMLTTHPHLVPRS